MKEEFKIRLITKKTPRYTKNEMEETPIGYFETRTRYLASSLIVTIPVKLARELGIKLGDEVSIQIQKKNDID